VDRAPHALAPSAAPSVAPSPERVPSTPGTLLVQEARGRIRAPWAAGFAGLLFAILFTAALWLIRSGPWNAATDAGLAAIYAQNQEWPLLIGGLYLAPFAGIMFLWFIAVVRDQIGEREDQFFATVFLGSGLIFVGTLFAAAALAVAPTVGVRYLDQGPPTADYLESVRSFAYTLLFAYATRAAAVFMFATATITLRSRTFPRAIAWSGYVLGLALLLVVSFFDWIILALPAWVAVLSLVILRRERAARRHVEGSSA